MREQSDPGQVQHAIDTSVPHPARRYNYWLGGKDNFAADRASGDQIAAAWPSIRTAAIENRGFLKRVTTFLTAEVGIRQFLDIGTGLPTADNTHEVAQAVAPDTRVVYVDNDPMVGVHARALMTSTPQGATAYLEADLREPEAILRHPDLARTLDLGRPVALMLIAVLHFVRDLDEVTRIVRRLVSALPSGSHVATTNATKDFLSPEGAAAYDALLAAGRLDVFPRSRQEIAEIFAGLEAVEPGIVPVSEWRAGGGDHPDPADVSVLAAVYRVP
ncbi:SAM-dependent methyltransferase [Plantactinospora sp. KBS50]|uniref:SAM-dependent methyltransferase n=1 Tax=Plantactinospora sp. KBS50 TaxID=2024580 RepID=UPI000BAAB330|nr:SAM-dependent methyltransferase [Plantactinospora sp. KBS50]ASW54102.1 methyltransferase [Plantactinospora sp. KBS50]